MQLNMITKSCICISHLNNNYSWFLLLVSHTGFEFKKGSSVSCFSGLSGLCFEAECVSYFSPTLGAVQPDLSPVEISSLPNIGNLCAGTLSTPPHLSPILTLIAVDHVAKLAYIVFIDLHLLAFHKCRYSSLNLGLQWRQHNKIQWIDEVARMLCFWLFNDNDVGQIGCGNLHFRNFQVAKKVELLAIITWWNMNTVCLATKINAQQNGASCPSSTCNLRVMSIHFIIHQGPGPLSKPSSNVVCSTPPQH